MMHTKDIPDRARCGDVDDEQMLRVSEIRLVVALMKRNASVTEATQVVALLCDPEVRELVRIIVDLTPSS